MKKVGLVLFCFLMGCALFDRKQSPTARKQVRDEDYQTLKEEPVGLKHRLMILPFLDASEQRSPEFRVNSRDQFIREINKKAQLIALGSDELKVDPATLIDKGEYKLKDFNKEVSALGISAVLEGKILDIRVKRDADKVGIVRHLTTTFEVVLRVRMISAGSGREIFNTVKTVSLEQQDVRVAERVATDKFVQEHPEIINKLVKEAFLEFIPQVTSALQRQQWQGRIAALQGERIYLNVGRISGIQIGDILKVTDEGDEVFDPETGGSIGKVPGRLKGTLEVISYFGQDGSIAIIHSGAGFRENDHVENY